MESLFDTESAVISVFEFYSAGRGCAWDVRILGGAGCAETVELSDWGVFDGADVWVELALPAGDDGGGEAIADEVHRGARHVH